ncbi:hypothetical protein QBC36DRAFT_383129 [Triangularia setosa]|uniref:Uncharacterized protein n=1 Tax=Triangularia setosa TaxID=2587417 RepID=A0AAN6WKI4_9PEZI|nr:hypothetical protein QBC36DRAFT_383129 [Podospora setosa]
MTPKRLQILQPLTSQPWPLTTVACRYFASSSEIKTNHKPNPPKPSLYQVLFPKDPTPKPTKANLSHSNSNSTTPSDDPEPPRISLQDDQELGEWMKQLHFNFLHNSNKTDTEHKDADIPTVLILSAPRDLLESDFYRVSPKGQHVQGWTSGPDKVIQFRSPNHLTPNELYYLFFPSRASATYYLSLLKHQHSLARSALFSLLSLPSPSTPSDPLPYSLIPPHTPSIPSSLHPLSSLVSSYFSHTLPKSRQATTPRLPLFQPLFTALSATTTSTTTGDNHPYSHPHPPQQNFILLRLHNGKIAHKALHQFIRADSANNRNGLHWALLTREQMDRYRCEQVTPLRGTLSYAKLPESYKQQLQQQKGHVNEEEEEEGEEGTRGVGDIVYYQGRGVENYKKKGVINVYSRFIIGFEHPTEAKRFARCWHKKKLVDEVRGQRMVCNTTVLW